MIYSSKIQQTLFRAVVLFLLLTCNLELFTSLRPETVNWMDFLLNSVVTDSLLQKNRMHLDRFVSNVVASVRCNIKHISAPNLKVHFNLSATRPIRDLWLNIVFYYKYNGIVYNKFPVDVWENACEFLDGNREKKFMMTWLYARLLPFTNFNHSCPYSNFIIKADNVSLEKTFSFTESIFPSGRYRVNVMLTEYDRVPFFEYVIFGSISEHYLEKI